MSAKGPKYDPSDSYEDMKPFNNTDMQIGR